MMGKDILLGGRLLLEKVKDQAREIADLKTRIINIEQGKKDEIAFVQGQLAKARMEIAEKNRAIDRLQREDK